MNGTSASTYCLTGEFHRVVLGHAKALVPKLRARHEPVHRPARVAIMLALAHKVEQAISQGVARDRADVARRLGVTRARITQLLDLVLLAPDIQEEILDLESVDGLELCGEHTIRGIIRKLDWSDQRDLWAKLRPAATQET